MEICILFLVFGAIFQAASAQCPEDWKSYGDSCYHFDFRVVSWNEARALCDEMVPGSYLVEIENAEELQFLMEHQGHNEVGYHIGGSDADTESRWIWKHSGNPMTYTNWSPGEPNDNYIGEDCAEMEADGEWNDVPCETDDNRFICEIPINAV